MITGEVRVSYANVWEPAKTPSGDMKYSMCLLIPKDDTESIGEVHDAIQAAVQKGLDNNKFGKAHVPKLRLPIRDGDAEFEEGSRGPEYKGHFFINASSKNPPGMVDKNVKPIIDQDDFYSGCFARVDINFFPYNTAGNVGIGVGLNNIMKTNDGDRLDGRMNAEDAFAGFGQASEPDESSPNDMDDDDIPF